MKTFEKYNKIDKKEREKLFLEIAHLDELEIRFELIKHRYSIFYNYKNKYLFEQFKSSFFTISIEHIMYFFITKYGHKYDEHLPFMKSMVKKYFKLDCDIHTEREIGPRY